MAFESEGEDEEDEEGDEDAEVSTKNLQLQQIGRSGQKFPITLKKNFIRGFRLNRFMFIAIVY